MDAINITAAVLVVLITVNICLVFFIFCIFIVQDKKNENSYHELFNTLNNARGGINKHIAELMDLLTIINLHDECLECLDTLKDSEQPIRDIICYLGFIKESLILLDEYKARECYGVQDKKHWSAYI